ncbi:MAG: NADP-dependent oxidoreductase [Bacteroidia bacterium]
MKAYLLNEAGKAENLTLADVSIPAIQANEVLIRVKSISINPVDVKARRNDGVLSWIYQNRRPVILGWDIAGLVETVGEHVTEFKPGDAVFGMVNFIGSGNAYAEYVAAPASQLAIKPENISFAEAAGATLAALTAHQALTIAGVKAGHNVLIHGASGGVGHYAVQMAKVLGATVTGTSSAQNKDFVLALGADKHIDYSSSEMLAVSSVFDFALDPAQGETLLRTIDAVKPGGKIITIPSGNIDEQTAKKAADKNIDLSFMLVASNGNDMKAIARLMAEGKLKTHIEQTFPFSQMAAAHSRLEAGKVRGKIIVDL